MFSRIYSDLIIQCVLSHFTTCFCDIFQKSLHAQPHFKLYIALILLVFSTKLMMPSIVCISKQFSNFMNCFLMISRRWFLKNSSLFLEISLTSVRKCTSSWFIWIWKFSILSWPKRRLWTLHTVYLMLERSLLCWRCHYFLIFDFWLGFFFKSKPKQNFLILHACKSVYLFIWNF